MSDERTLVAHLEGANTEELVQLILDASAAEEKVLRIYLGNERFRRMRNLVLRREMARDERRRGKRANVVVVPGVLGCEMISLDRRQRSESLWLNPASIVAGYLDRLRLDENGLTEVNTDYTVRVSGIMKRPYGELMLALAEHYNVQAFWYDWRKDFRLAATQLQARIDNWFPANEPVHLVAHAAGGLVARTYIHQFPERWALGESKLIMLGTPNYGLYTAPQGITGHLDLLRWIDLLDTYHDRHDFREIIRSFPSLYQMLPAPHLDFGDEMEALYDAQLYGTDHKVPQPHLTSAKEFHQMLATAVVDPARMVYIGGHNQPTYVGLDVKAIRPTTQGQASEAESDQAYMTKAYRAGMNGDGTVAHAMGVLRTTEGIPVPAFYTEALHGDLPSHPKVLMAVHELIATAPEHYTSMARTCGLMPLTDDVIHDRRPDLLAKLKAMRAEGATQGNHDPQSTFEALVRRVNSRGDASLSRQFVLIEEREIEERLMFGFVSGEAGNAHKAYQSIELATPKIRINLVAGDITDNQLAAPAQAHTIDALAVGHYSGSKPHGILRTLDYKISRKLAGKETTDSDVNNYEDLAHWRAASAPDADLLLTQYTQRGTIRADLAQTFFLSDPRSPLRTVAIAGMGEPGRFSVPELTVLVRELCWSLGRMGKKHLATVLIGVGRENLSVIDAVNAWIRGIKLAISGLPSEAEKSVTPHALQEITFFLNDPRKLVLFDKALRREKEELARKKRMCIDYEPLKTDQIKMYEDQAFGYVKGRMERQRKLGVQQEEANEPAPSRITVSVEGETYRFGAVTDYASIPEREIPLDPALVRHANDELAAEADGLRQLELGRFMQRLLIPADLRGQLATNAPLIMMLDKTTARIHWELLALSDLTDEQSTTVTADEPHLQFLGTSRGFTRQLRTVHAPPPEPPPPPQRHLRVLVIADPAADAHLPGAEEEGIAVADLFEQFNVVHAQSLAANRVEVVRLFGPREATRTTVLRHLMMRTYDVLHFAGHCVYDEQHPAKSGWIFSNGERLSAYEFTRIDRSPAFVFSNACESGVTPARSDERSVDLAPSFAESFFARGVTNFVCTAWPVDDRAARDFALTLYTALLGLEPTKRAAANTEQRLREPSILHSNTFQPATPLAMYQAMTRARRAIAEPPSDIRTWGAYQHYGNPYFRFFDPAGMGGTPGTEDQPVAAQADTATAPPTNKTVHTNGNSAAAEPATKHASNKAVTKSSKPKQATKEIDKSS